MNWAVCDLTLLNDLIFFWYKQFFWTIIDIVSEKHCGKKSQTEEFLFWQFSISLRTPSELQKQQVIHSVKTQMCAIQTGLK